MGSPLRNYDRIWWTWTHNRVRGYDLGKFPLGRKKQEIRSLIRPSFRSKQKWEGRRGVWLLGSTIGGPCGQTLGWSPRTRWMAAHRIQDRQPGTTSTTCLRGRNWNRYPVWKAWGEGAQEETWNLMYLNSCLDVSDLTQKEFLKPGETELALISKSTVFKFSFFLPLAGVGT